MLFALDTLMLNQGVIVFLVGLWILFVGLPRTFLSKHYAVVRAQRLRNIAIYATAAFLVVMFDVANNRLAQGRAELLVSAVKAFHTDNKRYPQCLEQLVPDYVERVPLAKYTLMLNEFRYHSFDDDAFLSYVYFPPFDRATFRFATDDWIYLD